MVIVRLQRSQRQYYFVAKVIMLTMVIVHLQSWIKAVACADECKIIMTKAQCENQNLKKKAAVSTNGYQNICISIKLNHDGCSH